MKPKHLPEGKQIESDQGMVTKKQTPIRQDKHAVAYKQLSDEFGYNKEKVSSEQSPKLANR